VRAAVRWDEPNVGFACLLRLAGVARLGDDEGDSSAVGRKVNIAGEAEVQNLVRSDKAIFLCKKRTGCQGEGDEQQAATTGESLPGMDAHHLGYGSEMSS
jgi:hypothetical protein